jgi:hypothetical protein
VAPLRVALASFVIPLLLAACGSVAVTPPAPTPADFTGIATELTKRGLVLDKLTSGDAGCDDQTLTQTAIGFDAKGLDQADPVRLRIYIFRNRDAFDRLRSTVDTCARSYVTDPDTYEALEQSPYVLTGVGPWPPPFKAVLQEALQVAAGTGD